MYYVYVLELNDKRFYSGRTDNLRRRFNEHRSGGVKSTRYFRPHKLVFYEAFANKADAIRREKYLKTSKGKSTLRIMLRDFLTER